MGVTSLMQIGHLKGVVGERRVCGRMSGGGPVGLNLRSSSDAEIVIFILAATQSNRTLFNPLQTNLNKV